MKRSAFISKPAHKGFAKPATLESRRGAASEGLQRAGKPLRAGRKTKEWETARRALKVESEREGRTTCELRGVLKHECTYNNFLGYAHDAKRRKLSKEDLGRAILICNAAHSIIEFWKPEEMKRIVNDTIAARKVAA